MIEIYIDGASKGNPGESGAGIYIKGKGLCEQYSFPLGIMSNHEAEFAALVKALQICLEKNITHASFRTDSQLVQQAVEKKYVKKSEYAPYLDKALPLIDTFQLFFIKWIPQSQNKIADKLAREGIRKNRKEVGSVEQESDIC